MGRHEAEVAWAAVSGPGWESVQWKELLSSSRGDGGEFVVGLVLVAPGGQVPAHAWDHVASDYVISGRARLHAPGGILEIGPGSCVYHAGDTPAVEVVGSEPLQCLRTFACERLPAPVRRRQPLGAGASPAVGRESDVAWRAVEPSKGLRIRVKRLLDLGVEMMAGICEFDVGVHYTRHYHDQPEVYFVMAGAAVVYKGAGEVVMGPGSALYLGSREVHGLDSVGTEPVKLFWAYGCETAGHQINWTPVEPIYEAARPHGSGTRQTPL